MTMHKILLLVHILCMAGVFGGLVACLAAGRSTAGDLSATLRAAARPLNILLLVGFLAGMGLYVYRMPGDGADAGPLHAIIGVKMLLFLGVGAMLGISSSALKKDNVSKARLYQLIAVILCVMAATFGVWV